MAELLPNRRYCRFRERKRNKAKMNSDDAVDFKVNRFIKDVNKYREKSKKKKELKELKAKEDTITIKKGLYKSAVLSHAGVKGLFSGSTRARLKGDLIDLSKKHKSSKKKQFSEILLLEGMEPRESIELQKTVEETDSIVSKSPQILPLNLNEASTGINYLETSSVENKNPEQTTQDSDYVDTYVNKMGQYLNESRVPGLTYFKNLRVNKVVRRQDELTPSKRGNQVIEDNMNPGGFFLESENAFMNIAVTDASKNNSKNDNCKLILDEEPPKKMKDFFDLLRKSSEKINRSTFESIITSVATPTLEHQHSFKISSPKSRRQSNKSHAQPEEYIFKFNPQRNEWCNQFDFTENNEEKFDLSPKFYKSYSPPKFKNFSVKFPCFFSDELMSTNLLGINKSIPQPSEQISSVSEHELKESPSFHKKHLLFNYSSRMKTFLPIKKFEKEETKFLIPKEKNKIENKFKEQFYQRKRNIYKKERDVYIKKHSLLRSNSRYNTSFKFSPHKYC